MAQPIEKPYYAFNAGIVSALGLSRVDAEALQLALDFDLAILGVSDIHGLIDWDYPVHDGGQRTTTLVGVPSCR